MNPPFGGRNGHVPWLLRFLEHANGIAIVRAYTSSAWWHDHMPRAELICFPRGKTKFIRADGSIGTAPGHGSLSSAWAQPPDLRSRHRGLACCGDAQVLLSRQTVAQTCILLLLHRCSVNPPVGGRHRH